MSEEVTNLPASKTQIIAGRAISALIPSSLDEVFRLSQAVSVAGMAPHGLETPAKITIAILAGLELGLPPMQALQSIAVVNNRPCIWGDGLLAVIRASGECSYIKEWIEGEGDKRVALCETKRRGEADVVVRTFSVEDAKRAGLWQDGNRSASPWSKYPQRMLAMRARSWCLRDVYADILRGLQTREEVEDYEPTLPREKMDIGAKLQVAAPTATETPVQDGADSVAADLAPEPTIATDNPQMFAVPAKKGPGRPKGYSPKKAQEAPQAGVGPMTPDTPSPPPAAISGQSEAIPTPSAPLNKRIEAEFEVVIKDPSATVMGLTNILDKYRSEIMAADSGMKKQLSALTGLYEGKITLAKQLRTSLAAENNANPETGEIEEEAPEAPAEEAPQDEPADGLNDDQRNVLYELRMALDEVDNLVGIDAIVRDFGKAVISNDVKAQAVEIKQARIKAIGGEFAAPF